MAIIVKAPDGSNISFPEGTPQATMERAMLDAFAGRKGKTNLPETVLEQGFQGATFGFGDELTDRLAAAAASGITGRPYKEMLGQARQGTTERLKQQMTERPVASIASNIAGSLLSGGSVGLTKSGAAIGNIIRSGGAGARVAKGAVAGAASGGLYGAGIGQEGNRAESAKTGALIGGAFGGAVPAVGAGISGAVKNTKAMAKGAFSRTIEQLDETVQNMRQAATVPYQKMREIGAEFTPLAQKSITDFVAKTLKDDGLLNQGLHGKTISILRDLSDESDLSLEKLDQYRQLFGQVAGNITPDNLQDARKASLVIEAIDNAIDDITPESLTRGDVAAADALKQARAAWAQKSKFERVADIVKKSDGDANYLKREMKKLLDNKKLSRGFSSDERKALEDAASLGFTEGTMKMLGKFGFDFGNSRIGNTALPVIGGFTAGATQGAGIGAAVPLIGTAARYGQKAISRGKVENLLDVIQSGGRVPTKEIMSLPPKDAKKLLNAMINPQAGSVSASKAQINMESK